MGGCPACPHPASTQPAGVWRSIASCEERPASVPPLRPAPGTMAQILLLEIHSQLNREAQRENGGYTIPRSPATARPMHGPGLPGEDRLPPGWNA